MSVINLSRQKATPGQKDLAKGIIPYGNFNNFPLRLAHLVQNSPTGSACIDTRSDFIEGAGFSDATLKDRKINSKGERFGDIHALTSSSDALFEGWAWNIKYNAKGTVSELYSIPFEYCRFAIPDDKGNILKIRVNSHYGDKEWKEADTIDYDTYNPAIDVVKSQQARDGNKYKGQILYVASTTPLSRFYPSPSYYSGQYWFGVDEAIGGFHKTNINNNFLQSVMINVIGDEARASTHPDDLIWDSDTNSYIPNPKITAAERFNIEMQKFTGWDKAGNAMVFWSRTAEEAPKINAFPSNTNSDLFRTIQDLTTEMIARCTKVPPVLANIQLGANLGGDGNVIRASVKLMQQITAKRRAALERSYTDVLSYMEPPYTGEVKILNYNPFPELEKIDPLIWEALPQETKLAWIEENTEFKVLNVPRETSAPVPVQNSKFSALSIGSYPAKCRENAKKAIDFRAQMGAKCGTPMGWKTAQDIAEGKQLSYKIVGRICRFLKKTEAFSNALFSDSCESLLYSAWGGKEMLEWGNNIKTMVDE